MSEKLEEKVNSFIEKCGLEKENFITQTDFINIVNNPDRLPQRIYTLVANPEQAPNPDYFGFMEYQIHTDPSLEQLTLYTLSYNDSHTSNLREYFSDVYKLLRAMPSDIVFNVVNQDDGLIPNIFDLQKLISKDYITRCFIARINDSHGGIALNQPSKWILDLAIKAWGSKVNLFQKKNGKQIEVKLSTIAMENIEDAQQKLYRLNIQRVNSLNNEQL
jgi:hypothetical protein